MLGHHLCKQKVRAGTVDGTPVCTARTGSCVHGIHIAPKSRASGWDTSLHSKVRLMCTWHTHSAEGSSRQMGHQPAHQGQAHVCMAYIQHSDSPTIYALHSIPSIHTKATHKSIDGGDAHTVVNPDSITPHALVRGWRPRRSHCSCRRRRHCRRHHPRRRRPRRRPRAPGAARRRRAAPR